MQADEEDFLKWVSDPARTNEELFTVEILLEQARNHQWPHHYVEADFEAQIERARQRKLNPAYRPALHLDELRTLINTAEKRTVFSGAHGDDRPLRDLSALRFFPALAHVAVQSSDVTDFTPVASLKNIKYFSVAEYGDLYGCHPVCLAQCGEMPNLERLHLALRHPWPDLRGMSKWPKLESITFNGPIMALEDVPSFPASRVVMLKTWAGSCGELRNLRCLPLMPVVRELTISSTSSLEGIERYPSVLNLELAGCYRDLSPLAQMENVTALKLSGERFQDLRPLSRMQNLREVTFEREWPLDLSPLVDCPQLRRVDFAHCAMMRTEVAALNAALLPEADDFLAPSPRPLQPLKFYCLSKDSPGEKHFRERTQRNMDERVAFYDGDAARMKAESRVFLATMQAKFDELLGRDWGSFTAGFVTVKRYQDTIRLRELIDIVREYQARAMHPPAVTFVVEPHGDMTDELEQIRAREAKESPPDEDFLLPHSTDEDLLEHNAEWRRLREERYELLKREHLLKLRGEEEAAVLLGLPEDELEEAEQEAPAEEEPFDETEGEGGIAIAPPPPPPKGEQTESLSDQLMFYLEVWEDCVTANLHWAEQAQYCLGQKFEQWMP